MISPTEIYLFVLRIVVLVMAVAILVGMFFALREITTVSEVEHSLGSVADGIMSSGLTSGRSVFDRAKLADSNGSLDEPSRTCRFGAMFELTTLVSPSESWRFGFEPNQFVLAGVKSIDAINAQADKSYAVWLGKTPASLKVSMYDTWFTELACAIERAWTYERTYRVKFQCSVPERKKATNMCEVYSFIDMLCVGDMLGEREAKPECREVPGGLQIKDWRATPGMYTLDAIPIMNVEGASSDCQNPTTFTTDEERGTLTASTVILCPAQAEE